MSIVVSETLNQELAVEAQRNPLLDWFISGYSRSENLMASRSAARRQKAKRKSQAAAAYKKKQARRKPLPQLPVGENPNSTPNAKKHESVSAGSTVVATRTLTTHDLTDIPRTTSNHIGERQSDQIVVSGFSIEYEFKNQLDVPVYFNFAVVSPKGTNAVSNLAFFRATGDSRAVDFGAAGLTSIDYANRPVNTDLYHVHKHKRYLLSGNKPSSLVPTEPGAKPSFGVGKLWIPFGRALRYSRGASDTSPEDGATYIVYWCDQMLSGAGASTPNAMVLNIRAISYFREHGNW